VPVATAHAICRARKRLNHSEDDHLALLKLMKRYWQSATHEDDAAMRDKARGIFRAEWIRLKDQASGIDPFVREAVPQRKVGAVQRETESRATGVGSGAE
jgi:hypothetical protein